jgi:hypothetical protein
MPLAFGLRSGGREAYCEAAKHIRFVQHKPRSGELWVGSWGGAKRNPRIKAAQIRNPRRATSRYNIAQ